MMKWIRLLRPTLRQNLRSGAEADSYDKKKQHSLQWMPIKSGLSELNIGQHRHPGEVALLAQGYIL